MNILVSREDLCLLELAEDLVDVKDAKKALKEYDKGQVVTLNEIEQRLNEK